MTTRKNVNNIRFLLDQLGELLVNYLAYPIRVLQSIAQQEDVKYTISPYLQVDVDRMRQQPKRFASILKSACKRAGVPQIGIAVQRQMSSAIINTHFDQADRECFTIAQDANVSNNDIEEDGADLLAATLVSMLNHSLRIHWQAYTNVSPFANVQDSKLVKSYRASEVQATFFRISRSEKGVPNTQVQVCRRKRGLSDIAIELGAARKVLNIRRDRLRR